MGAQLHALDLLALQEIDEGIVAEAAHGALGEGEVALVVAAPLPAQARLGLGAALGGGLLLLRQALGDSAVVPVERLLHHRIAGAGLLHRPQAVLLPSPSGRVLAPRRPSTLPPPRPHER